MEDNYFTDNTPGWIPGTFWGDYNAPIWQPYNDTFKSLQQLQNEINEKINNSASWEDQVKQFKEERYQDMFNFDPVATGYIERIDKLREQTPELEYPSDYVINLDHNNDIKLTTGRWNTGHTNTAILDAINKAALLYSLETGEDYKEALFDMIGLAANESNLGQARSNRFNEHGLIYKTTLTDLMSNWALERAILNNNSARARLVNLKFGLLEGKKWSADDYAFARKFEENVKRENESYKPVTENPIINALKRFRRGLYAGSNPDSTRNKNYRSLIAKLRSIILSDPAIKKWLASIGIE